VRSTASVGKHPIHPALIVFPIALFITSFVFDITYLATRELLWYRIAYYDIVVGIIGALLAAIPGFTDYFTVRMTDKEKSTATTHMLLNLLVVVLFIINVAIRYGDKAAAGSALTWAVALSIIGIGIMSYSGWLGADLVHRYGIGIDLSEAEETTRATGAAGAQPGWAGAKGGETPEEPQ
jgi:uncharacterized membrane protein